MTIHHLLIARHDLSVIEQFLCNALVIPRKYNNVKNSKNCIKFQENTIFLLYFQKKFNIWSIWEFFNTLNNLQLGILLLLFKIVLWNKPYFRSYWGPIKSAKYSDFSNYLLQQNVLLTRQFHAKNIYFCTVVELLASVTIYVIIMFHKNK